MSVALCTYQGARFVGEQLESILGQTRAPDEVVVSDDGSTDGTVDRVEEIARGASVPVRVYANRRLGYRKNFEAAVEACTGQIVFLADQDDVWLPHRIAAMLPTFSPGVALVHCDGIVTDAQLAPRGGTIFSHHADLHVDRRRSPVELVRGVGIPGCTMAFPASMRKALSPFSELWGHDLWIALVGASLGDIVPVPEPLMLYRRHPEGAGPSSRIDRRAVGRLRIGTAARRRGAYEEDLAKWTDVVCRLERLEERIGADDPGRERLRTFLAEYRRRLALARFRADVRRRPRIGRVAPVARRVLAGEYRRHLRPVASPVKDVLA